MIVDAKNAVAGRLASTVAKKLLEGERIIIINSEQAIVTGRPQQIKEKYLHKRGRGNQHGPFIPKRPDLVLRRIIRGMLPYKEPRGRRAMKSLMIYIGYPEKFEGRKTMVIENSAKEVRTTYLTIKKLSKSVGWSE